MRDTLLGDPSGIGLGIGKSGQISQQASAALGAFFLASENEERAAGEGEDGRGSARIPERMQNPGFLRCNAGPLQTLGAYYFDFRFDFPREPSHFLLDLDLQSGFAHMMNRPRVCALGRLALNR